MFRRLLAVLLSTALSACAAGSLCPQRHAVVHQAAMSCAELNQVTAAAMKRMGYDIKNFVPATNESAGTAQGTRRDDYDNTYSITVDMRCSASEAVADAVSSVGCAGQIGFPNEFQQSFQISMAKKVQGPTLVPKEQQAGLRLQVEPQRDADKAIGVPLASANLMAVKVAINNRTSRVYRIGDEAFTLVSENGSKVTPLPAAEAAKLVARAVPAQSASAAAALAEKSLKEGRIEADGKVEGYLFVPRQAYRRATVKLIDEEADEPEGFVVEF